MAYTQYKKIVPFSINKKNAFLLVNMHTENILHLRQIKQDFLFLLDEILIFCTLKLTPTENNEKKFYKAEFVDINYELKNKLKINLTNLFGGDKEKGNKLFHIMSCKIVGVLAGAG